MGPRIGRDLVVRCRAPVGHLDAKLAAGSFAEAAWGGLRIPSHGVG